MPLRLLPILAPLILFAQITSEPGSPGPNDEPGKALYKIDIHKVYSGMRQRNGKPERYVTVQFSALRTRDGQPAIDIGKEEIKVEEDGQPVGDLEIFQPRTQDPLTVILALDISGSMNEHGKMEQARKAALTFLDRLHDQVDCGLILFNHEVVQPTIPPIGDSSQLLENRRRVRDRIQQIQAAGGTAYFDAAAEAVNMLRNVRGRKAILLVTDGVDTNSRQNMEEVVTMAQTAQVPIYTLGIGEPGKKEPVTTVLVLDCSGSMNDPADDNDRISKIEALRNSASRFVDLMRPDARTTLIPFSSQVPRAAPFTNDKSNLKKVIRGLRAEGATLLFDAIHDAVWTLQADDTRGKHAVVVLTDGKDEGSRRRVEEIVEEAREAHIPLHLLGLGAPGELDEPTMRFMAEKTGGTYQLARNQRTLYEIFENLSIQLHDDGIDEDALRNLAERTGGEYKSARNVAELEFIYEKIAEQLQSTYSVTFTSHRSSHDGTARGIDITVWRNGARISDIGSVDYNVHGVVVPELSSGVYLAFLVFLGGLLLLPLGLKHLYRFYGGT